MPNSGVGWGVASWEERGLLALNMTKKKVHRLLFIVFLRSYQINTIKFENVALFS